MTLVAEVVVVVMMTKIESFILQHLCVRYCLMIHRVVSFLKQGYKFFHSQANAVSITYSVCT